MKYETPELTALTPAINAIQGPNKGNSGNDNPGSKDSTSAYEDWE
jgi:hypothetical protein